MSMFAMGLPAGTDMASMGHGGGGTTPPAPFVAAIFGQSQPNYLIDSGSFYQQIAQPVPGDGNLIVYEGTTPTKTTVNAASVAAGQVNPVMAAWSALFDHVMPGREFVVVDLCEGGTGRNDLMNDADTGRNWSDLETVLAAVRADYGDIDQITECWMGNDVATAQTMPVEWSPLYIGQSWDGDPFTLGNPNPDSVQNPAVDVDHCLWDIEAAADAFGRGVFKRDTTKWSIVGWPAFNAPLVGEGEMDNFTDRAGYPTQADRDARENLSVMFNDPRFQTFAGYDGFSSHVARMREANGDTATHPDTTNPDGQILMGWPYALSILKGAGYAISEPAISGISGPDDGSYADIAVSLPNGGTLTTLREFRIAHGKAPTLADMEALRLEPHRTGCRLPAAALSVPGTDTLPAGASFDVATNMISVAEGATVAEFRGWDFSGCYLEIEGAVAGGFVDCMFSSRTSQATVHVLDIYTTATVGDIRHCTFRGVGFENIDLATILNERFIENEPGNSQGPTMGDIHHCAFFSYPNDCIKLAAGGRAIYLNYFDTPSALKNVPGAYDGGTAYAAFDAVSFSGNEYVALQATTGNAPSGTTGNTAFWKYVAPHSDVINPRAVIGGPLEIWGNFINMAQDQRRVSDTGEPWGMTNGLRLWRNSGSSVEQGEIFAHHNVVSTMGPAPATAGQGVTYPVAMGPDGNTDNWTPNRVTDNWITLGANARYTYEADPTADGNIFTGNIPYDRTAASEQASPHRQMVTGFEVTRGAGRRPVYRESQTSYPVAYRGQVMIADSGSGSPRTGTVRIIPEVPFAFGDDVDYLRGDAGAILLENRDADAELFKDMLIEHVPVLYDATATYPCEGVPVRPMPPSLAVPVAEPTFTARAATFDGATYLESTDLATPATAQGLLSMWFRNDLATWENLDQLVEMRAGFTDVFNLRTNTSGRLRLDLGASVVSFYAGPTSATPFTAGQWYHLLIAWDDTALTIHVNGVEAVSQTITTPAMAGSDINRFSIGDRIGGGLPWTGQLGHVWMALGGTLDLSVQANREKFALAGAPVDLGSDGSTPTESAPAFYFDGAAPAWGNQGTGGVVPVAAGALTAGPVPGY